jgi:guanylate kinase
MSHWQEFDYVVVNDDFEGALADIRAILDGRGADCATSSEAARARVALVMT